MIRRLGEFSTALLASPEFKDLNALFEQQIAVDVLGTKPDDAVERERIYAMLQGSRAFTSHIERFANDYAILITPVVDTGPDEDDPSVHDISPDESL